MTTPLRTSFLLFLTFVFGVNSRAPLRQLEGSAPSPPKKLATEHPISVLSIQQADFIYADVC